MKPLVVTLVVITSLLIFLYRGMMSTPIEAVTENSETIEKASKIIVYKADRRMELVDSASRILKSYKIALGGNPTGHKTQEGDERTPEGLYSISGRNPHSVAHLSLRISYPNQQDVAQAVKRGVSPGGDIMIHGLPNGMGWIGSLHLLYDTWTNGCIGVTNREIEEIWKRVPDGIPIEIQP